MSIPYSTQVTMLDAVTADTTSAGYDVSKRQQIVVEFVCANHTSGNGVFTIDGTTDGTNWVTGIAVQDVTATASTTWVNSMTLSANGTSACYVKAGWKEIRCKVDQTTDGTYSAIMHNG